MSQLLRFTPADILRSRILPEQWKGMTCVKVSPPESSKDEKSVNWKITFLVDNAEGKEIDYLINSKGIGFHLSLVAAMMGTTKELLIPEALETDMETWVGKKVDGHIVQDSYKEQVNNKISEFLPYGKSVTMATGGVAKTF